MLAASWRYMYTHLGSGQSKMPKYKPTHYYRVCWAIDSASQFSSAWLTTCLNLFLCAGESVAQGINLLWAHNSVFKFFKWQLAIKRFFKNIEMLGHFLKAQTSQGPKEGAWLTAPSPSHTLVQKLCVLTMLMDSFLSLGPGLLCVNCLI